MSLKEIRDRYSVPAYRGTKVSMDGRAGVITSASRGRINVRFDGLNGPRQCHPTWRMIYHVEKDSPTEGDTIQSGDRVGFRGAAAGAKKEPLP